MSGGLMTTAVGSFAKPPYLVKARREHAAGRLSDEDLALLTQRATREIVALQEGVGLDILERQRVAHGAGGEPRSVASANGRASAHDSLVRDKGGTRSVHVVRHEGVQIAAIPRARSAVEQRERYRAGGGWIRRTRRRDAAD